MPRRAHIFVFLFMAFIGIGLSACTPTCDAGSLLPPDLISPDWFEVVDGSSAVLEWVYPDACEPEEYEIILSLYRDHSPIQHALTVPGDTTTVTAPTLDIAEDYYWRVRAKVGATYGAYSNQLRYFFTLPFCSATDLINPYPQFPLPHEIYDNNYDSFEWHWPLNKNCIPENYRIEVSRDENFIDDEFNGATGNPSTRWGLGSAPPPATKMWWRVSACADGICTTPVTEYSFYTAPACTGIEMIAPTLVSPADGAVVPATDQVLEWSWPPLSCIPDDTHVLVAEDSAFTILFDDHHGISANGMIYGHKEPFENCKTYYWRVAMHHDGIDGIWSPTYSFTVDLNGTCGLSGSPGIANGNFFCRKGTYQIFDALWTVEDGQRVLAIGRNPQSNYVLLNILDPETNKPLLPAIQCWAYQGFIDPGWPESPDGMELNFGELPIVIPPEPPEQDGCRADLGLEECKAAGGSYELVSRATGLYECVCP